jgi:hypothetical protein
MARSTKHRAGFCEEIGYIWLNKMYWHITVSKIRPPHTNPQEKFIYTREGNWGILTCGQEIREVKSNGLGRRDCSIYKVQFQSSRPVAYTAGSLQWLLQWTTGDEIELFHEVPGGEPERCQCIRWACVILQDQTMRTSPRPSESVQNW